MTASQSETLEGVGTLVANAVEQMERMLLSGDLPPGAKLREVALAKAIGVGRGPLREAIRILEGRRLLQRTPNAGVSVIDPSLDDFEQLLVTREALEGMAARLAAEQMGSADIEALRGMVNAIEAIDTQQAKPFGVFDTGPDRDFHRNIALGSRNLRIAQLLCEDLYSLLRLFRFRAAEVRTDPAETHAEHRAIIDCIQHRDADGAEQAMRAHVRRSRQTLLRHLRGLGAK
jgi:DNA-binding GntR family transcriptional regulator